MSLARPPLVSALATAAAALLGCCLLAPPLWAGEARLVETSGPERVVVETSDATVDEVLAALAAQFGFAVERGAPAAQPIRFSGRLQGSLDALLQRILRHETHLIVRSKDARAGISRVVLMETGRRAPIARQAPSAAVAGPLAALKAQLKLNEAGKKTKPPSARNGARAPMHMRSPGPIRR